MQFLLILFFIYLSASVVSFLVYAWDKWAARTRRQRTPERTLLTLGFLCGWPGAWLAQSVLRHKSVKQPFRAWFFTTVVLNVMIVSGMIYLTTPWE
jgi:uncharacterized membrane protein YsdA (DUF1294 family)